MSRLFQAAGDAGMKYKVIRSMAHNWTHSFMSGMNYIDGRYISQDMELLARSCRGQRVTISWVPVRVEEMFRLTPRVRECIAYYRKALPKHLEMHGVESAALAEFRSEIYVAENFRMYVRAYVKDDRGREHEAFVRQGSWTT